MLGLLAALSYVYLEEHFGADWEKRWARPDVVKRGVLLGNVRSSAGQYYADEKKQRGLETMDARRNYLLYSNFSKPFDNRGKDLILQFTVRLNMYVDCAGAYVKLLGPPENQTTFSNESAYSIMFGPDVCGATVHDTLLRINYNGKMLKLKPHINCYKDHLTHGYTLIIRKNGTIEVKIDGEIKASGPAHELFDIPNVTEIPDPSAVKPDDWVDVEYIVDENDKKPDDWVDDEFIEDPDAFRPPYIDDDEEWAAPMIRNPEYVGPWKPRMIPNPEFKGHWKPPMIKVDPTPDPTFAHFNSLTFLGIDVFQSCPGSIIGNFIVTDDEGYAKESLIEAFLSIRTDEIKHYDALYFKLKAERDLERQREMKDYDYLRRIDEIDVNVSHIPGDLKSVKKIEKMKENKLKEMEEKKKQQLIDL